MKQRYTSIKKCELETVLTATFEHNDKRTIQNLIDSRLKRERVLGRRLLGLALLYDANPTVLHSLRESDDWKEIVFYREDERNLSCEIVRVHA